MNSSALPKILIANGVNLDLLGQREPSVYGVAGLPELEKELLQFSRDLKKIYNYSCELEFYQSNDEGSFLNKLSEQSWAGIIINPGAWTHTSLALADRLAGLSIPYIEVHLSNTAARESFRHHSYISAKAKGTVVGLGFNSYRSAILSFFQILS